MKRSRWIHSLLLATVAAVLSACGGTAASQSPLMLRAGNQTLTVDEFKSELARQKEAIQGYVEQGGGTAEQARLEIFNSLVQSKVFLNEASKAGIGADSEMADWVNQVLAENVPPNAADPNKAPTTEDYETWAVGLGYGSLGNLRRFLLELRTLDKYAETIPGEVPSQAKLRHILISPPEGLTADAAMAETRQRAEAVLARVKAGEDFGALAKEFSADPGSAQNGGVIDMGPIDRYVPEFANAVRTLPLNTPSDLVQTEYGFHIIEVLERQAYAGWQGLRQDPAGAAYVQQIVD
ncbi:MAG TPA: peptidylprolyl isomerase, partial [Herpetosiphonaceae bacterium]